MITGSDNTDQKQAATTLERVVVAAFLMPKRIQVTLSAALERDLIIWAYLREETLPSWIKQVLRLRVNAVKKDLAAELNERAARLGMKPEELELKILEKYGFDPERELLELEGEE